MEFVDTVFVLDRSLSSKILKPMYKIIKAMFNISHDYKSSHK